MIPGCGSIMRENTEPLKLKERLHYRSDMIAKNYGQITNVHLAMHKQSSQFRQGDKLKLLGSEKQSLQLK